MVGREASSSERAEHQRGNVKVLFVFNSIDFHAAILRLQSSFTEKPSRKANSLPNSLHGTFSYGYRAGKLPDKTEIGNSCVPSAVLIVNILTDTADLASEMSKDLLFLQCLFDLFPFTSDDFETRNSLWSIVVRLLVQVKETEMNPSSFAPYV
ncbi:hypothetical protein Nepgr_014888 [Nepenthes gracilis]|uniref:Uncharacterized protein n=1 Tax=Nepenthes gracilis TaxID=150966 RepID=A0AAD3XPX4_NEPGR|nr:hypothetical protein Nepgr_014888 [Nepenthes gracilis]